MYSLSTSFCVVPRSFSRGHALLLADQLVQQQQAGGGRVDRHRRGHLIERDAVEGGAHVVDRVDRHAGAARPRRGSAGCRSPGRAASAGRRPSTGRSSPSRAGSGSARWTPSPRRSRRTGASSTVCLRYISRCTPRVYGNSPGSPRSSSSRQVLLGVELGDLDARVGEAARVVGADDRRDGQVLLLVVAAMT